MPNDPSGASVAFWQIFDIALKSVLPLLALAAAVLGVRLDAWDKECGRPKPQVYPVIVVAVSIAVASVLLAWVDQKVADFDKQQALRDQLANLQPIKDNVEKANTALGKANGALESANTALSLTEAIGLRQYPIENFEVWFKREEIKGVQLLEPIDFFYFHKKPHADFRDLERDAEEPGGFFDVELNMKYKSTTNKSKSITDRLPYMTGGKEAIDRFRPILESLCEIRLRPMDTNILFISGDEYNLVAAVLNKKYFVLTFRSDDLRAEYFANNRVRVDYVPPMRVAVGDSAASREDSMPATKCTLPREIKLRVTGFGLSGDTGFFSPGSSSKYSYSGLSPKIVLALDARSHQPAIVQR